MKLRLLLLSLSLGLVLPAFSQIDVTQLTADTKTFIFDDDKNTVKNYIYEELQAKTSCCGAARIYLEVKIAPSGYVLSAKTLTGKNDCYKKSAIDIVKNIKWNAAGFQGPKSVYFEIKPEVDCGDRANAYEALPIFNNAELDENGVPVNYANSTGVSALKSSGGATTGMPNPTVDPAFASSEPEGNEAEPDNNAASTETKNAGAGENETANEVAANTPPANAAAEDKGPETPGADAGDTQEKSEPIAEANTTKPPTTSATPAKGELEKARQAAALREDRNAQADEIQKLKEQLEAVKNQEEDRKKQDAEQARLATAEKERKEMNDARLKREEDDRNRRAAQRDTEERDRYADNSNSRDNDRNNNSRDSRSGSYDDKYADNGRGNDRDRGYNDGDRDTDPPRPSMTEAQRKEEEKRVLDDELRDIQNKMRESETEERRREADRRRMQQDLARVQERALLKGEEIQQAREREELEKLEEKRKDAEAKKREQEEQVRKNMEEIKRMQLDMERKMADLERLEKDLTNSETQKLTTEQQVAKNQEMRKAEIERQIDAIKMQAGISSQGSTAAPMAGGVPSIPINISANDSNAISILAQQIAQLRNEISNLQNYVVNTQGGGSFATATNSRTRSTPSAIKTAGSNAAKSGSWKKLDYRDPKDKKAEIYNSFGSSQGVIKANTHDNMAIGKMVKPKFAGNEQAMKKEIAQKLQAGGVCGLVQTSFIVTVSPSGEVVGYDITMANTPSVQLQLGPILKNLKFQSTPTTRMPSRALYQLKAEIVCEGEERININEIPDLINQ